ncbi:MAG: CapA family protein [Clostridia bacterium]|nr:CapA family protein [Clostridia bacterium]
MLKRLLIPILCLLLMTCCAAAEAAETITLSFLGDCSIGDAIKYRDYAICYLATIREKGADWPFSLVEDVLRADDLTVANLEVVLTTHTKTRQDKAHNLIGDPSHTEVILESGIDVVNTANNHAWDFRAQGYHDALGHLDAAGIPHFGTLYSGTPDGSDVTPIIDVNGVKVGFIGFSYPQEYDKKRISIRIDKLREEGAQLVVVSLHWGTEEKTQPTSGQTAYARFCIDEGADVVYGHHAHILQSVQFYKGKPIFYSTGNFTFGTMSHVDPDTGIFQLTYDVVEGETVLRRFSVVPCRTQGSGDYRPYILTDEEDCREMRRKLVHKAKVKNMTTVTDFFIENGYMDFEDGVAVGQ